jgi:hypothetical protein
MTFEGPGMTFEGPGMTFEGPGMTFAKRRCHPGLDPGSIFGICEEAFSGDGHQPFMADDGQKP